MSGPGAGQPSDRDPERDRPDSDDNEVTDSPLPAPLYRLWHPSSEGGAFARDLLVSILLVGILAVVLFGVSGIWPPLVAVESGSMDPNIHRGDLIFVTDTDRFVGANAVNDTGVVPRGSAEGYTKFGEGGDVIIFRPNGLRTQTPVIHRAHFWVEAGENWVDGMANPEFVGDATCAEVTTCPARHAGFITKGDANPSYDQVRGGAQTDVVKPAWITGKAMMRVPWLGHVRLTFDAFFSILGPAATGASSLAVAAVAVTRRKRIG